MQYIGKVVQKVPKYVSVNGVTQAQTYYRVRVPQLHGIAGTDQDQLLDRTIEGDNSKYRADFLPDDKLPLFLANSVDVNLVAGTLVLVGFTSQDIRSNGFLIGAYGSIKELTDVVGTGDSSLPPGSYTTGGISIPGGSASAQINSWVVNVVGGPAFERGDSWGTQCVEIVHQYLEDCFGIPQSPNGDGLAVAGRVAEKYPDTFTYIPYSEMVSQGGPKIGDIISYNSGSAPQWGHVAVVSSSYNGSTYSIVHQWAGSITVQAATYQVIPPQYAVSYSIIGVARPNISSPSTITDIEVEALAKVTAGEAGGLPDIEKSFVLWTVFHRVNEGRWTGSEPSTILNVINSPSQFDGKNGGNPWQQGSAEYKEALRQLARQEYQKWQSGQQCPRCTYLEPLRSDSERYGYNSFFGREGHNWYSRK